MVSLKTKYDLQEKVGGLRIIRIIPCFIRTIRTNL